MHGQVSLMKNKSKIIAENSGLTKSDVGRALDSLIQTIESTLKSVRPLPLRRQKFLRLKA